ncbi:MBL fold metallo-hydrolase [Xinfangfangia sp. D13-10-4-6]|uniref:MBL fold metallo-hydrolase n=1 Tax=Pseudogemmobacter hezensis TaxID=2737662 RepID=UPI001C13143B|nr:MBL fold metallo-hydrolase [Pseudogemmobacter hezensis]NPD14862.1 MBL fold metallo-hydrolase [Pseudogemmobacter hezensis]
MKTTLALGAVALAPSGIARAAGQALKWTHFPAGPNGFYRAPVLIEGATEAVLIDGGFTLPDGVALAESIKATGKKLTTIYISQSDPDYYFSLRPVVEAFPEARVLAATATVEAIEASVDGKLAVWGPQLGEAGPQSRADVVFATAWDEPTLTVDGETIEIITPDTMENRRYLWVPSLQAVFGGVLIFNGVHVWTADTQTPEIRAEWVKVLDSIAARNPAVVVAGHAEADAATDISGVTHTKAYLQAFDEELPKAADGAALEAAMKERFPGLGMEVAIQIGSKVAKGEMKWG